MTNVVSLATGKVSWVAPTTNIDGTPITTDEITGYIVGLRSVTAAGSQVGVYPIQSPPTDSGAVSDALAQIATNLKSDDYAVAVQTQSKDGPSAWSAEVLFTGTLPVPNPPSDVSVG